MGIISKIGKVIAGAGRAVAGAISKAARRITGKGTQKQEKGEQSLDNVRSVMAIISNIGTVSASYTWATYWHYTPKTQEGAEDEEEDKGIVHQIANELVGEIRDAMGSDGAEEMERRSGFILDAIQQSIEDAWEGATTSDLSKMVENIVVAAYNTYRPAPFSLARTDQYYKEIKSLKTALRAIK